MKTHKEEIVDYHHIINHAIRKDTLLKKESLIRNLKVIERFRVCSEHFTRNLAQAIFVQKVQEIPRIFRYYAIIRNCKRSRVNGWGDDNREHRSPLNQRSEKDC